MFKALKNPEVKKEFYIYVSISVFAALLCYLLSVFSSLRSSYRALVVSMVAPSLALCVFILGLAFSMVHLYFSSKRFQRVSDLSDSLDRILHGTESVLIKGSDEGELSILASEIQKMTVTLNEQTEFLKADKIRLTDAIADIFHQMRTPLTSMNLVVTLLMDENLSYERRVQLARELKKQLERMQWLVESLLKLSKIDAGTAIFASENIKVRDMLNKASEPFLIPMELRGQDLKMSVSDESYKGDLSWSVEAIGNLIKNAMEHTPEGGEVRIKALETAIYTEIVVEDTGEGFVKEDIPYLFERFYKGKNAGEGSIGIGLALSRAIITAQNGTIKAENTEEGGARFIVRFYKSVV